MNFCERDFFISRIKANYFRVKTKAGIVIVRHPDESIEYESKEVYLDLYNSALESDLIPANDVEPYLLYRGVMTEDEIEELKYLPEHIDTFKREMAECYLKQNTKEQIRLFLEKAKSRYSELMRKRSSIDYMTCEGYAEYFKNLYIVEHSSYYPDGRRFDFKKVLPEVVMNKYLSSMLSLEQIRELAKTPPWTEYWMTAKRNGRVFNNINLSLEQQLLLIWSITYENIYQSYDCPPRSIIEDDDVFDGWLALRREKAEKEKEKDATKDLISKNPKIQNAAEVFAKVESKEDAQKIEDLNSFESKKIKESRYNQLKRLGEVNYKEFQDIVNRNEMELNKKRTR